MKSKSLKAQRLRASFVGLLSCAALQAPTSLVAQTNPNSEAGIYTLTKLLVTAVGSLTPVSQDEHADQNIIEQVVTQRTGVHANYQMASGEIREIGSSRNARTSINDIPDIYIAALLATEDARFFEHPGVDPLGTARAFIEYLSGQTRGASGITQQLVKNQIVGSDLTFSRKAMEATLAIQVEDILTKEQILEAYLGVVWYGRGWGAAGAAQSWFGKDWDDLTLSETAFLAGILQGPGLFDPARHTERAHARRDHVLGRMLANDVITQAQYDEASAETLSTIPVQSDLGRQEWHDVTIEQWVSTNSSAAALLEPQAESDRLSVLETSLDARWQALAQSALQDQTARLGGSEGINQITTADLNLVRSRAEGEQSLPNDLWRRVLLNMSADERVLPAVLLGGDQVATGRGWGMNNTWTVESRNIPPGLNPGDVVLIDRDTNSFVTSRGIEGAVVVMNLHTGNIMASIGGSDVRVSRFDRSTALRQPGSAVKSFVYLTAFEAGWRAQDLIDDSRMDFGAGYNPQNYGAQSFGVIPFYTAFEMSSNVAAVKVANQVGISNISDTAIRAGAYTQEMDPYLPSALGASVTTLRDLVTGYATIGNGGYPVRASLVRKITDRDGQIWTINAPAAQIRFNDGPIEQIQSMMRGVVTRGTAAEAFLDHPVSIIGKTGTSQNNRDALFVGMGADVVIGVWLGRDDNQPTDFLLGGTHAAPVAAIIFREAFEAGLINDMGHDLERSSMRFWPPQAFGYSQGG